MLKVALTRILVLKNNRNLFYRFVFKISNEIKCIVQECESDLFKTRYTFQHIKTTFTLEHQIVIIIL